MMTIEAARRYLDENEDKLPPMDAICYRWLLLVSVNHYALAAKQYWKYLRETQGTEFFDILYSPEDNAESALDK